MPGVNAADRSLFLSFFFFSSVFLALKITSPSERERECLAD